MPYLILENEPTSPLHYRYPVKRILYRGRSPYQKILVFESPHHGRVLALDNVVQITSREEALYHEMIVHPAVQALPNPRRALVIGGGDGGAVRELAKYSSFESIVEAELDEEVVRISRKYFPKVAAGYKDPRVKLLYTDGYRYLRDTEERFDIIVVDLTDPVGPAKALFEEPFYRLCAERLTENGLLSAQTESLHFNRDVVQSVYQALARVFPVVEWVVTALAMYPGNWWTFSVGSKGLDPTVARNPSAPATQYYLRESHSWYYMPRPLRDKLLAAGS